MTACSGVTSLPSASPKPPGSTKSRCMSMMRSAVDFGSNTNSYGSAAIVFSTIVPPAGSGSDPRSSEFTFANKGAHGEHRASGRQQRVAGRVLPAAAIKAGKSRPEQQDHAKRPARATAGSLAGRRAQVRRVDARHNHVGRSVGGPRPHRAIWHRRSPPVECSSRIRQLWRSKACRWHPASSRSCSPTSRAAPACGNRKASAWRRHSRGTMRSRAPRSRITAAPS